MQHEKIAKILTSYALPLTPIYMIETDFELSEHTVTTVFYGVNNANIQLLENLHPNLRIIARGNVVKISGSEKETIPFIDNLRKLERYYLDNNTLTE